MEEIGTKFINPQYLAGYFDGEGCFRWDKKGRPVITLENTHPYVVNFLKNHYGGSLTIVKRQGRKDIYRYAASNIDTMFWLLNDIKNSLIEKQEIASKMIGWILWRRTQPKVPDWSTWNG